MGKGSRQEGDAGVPKDFPQATPRDLYPTSDIRFVLVEVGKLSATVERLVKDTGAHGEKLDKILHKISFLKGAMWVGGILVSLIIAVSAFLINARWNAILQILTDLARHSAH